MNLPFSANAAKLTQFRGKNVSLQSQFDCDLNPFYLRNKHLVSEQSETTNDYIKTNQSHREPIQDKKRQSGPVVNFTESLTCKSN